MGFTHLQFEALLTAVRQSPDPCDSALVACSGCWACGFSRPPARTSPTSAKSTVTGCCAYAALEDVTLLCDPDGSRAIQSFDDLEMGDYQRVLENPDRWAKLGWPLDQTTIIKRLDELRVVRNNVMHFNPEPVSVGAVEKLRYILKLLRDFGGPIAP
jgi:hypothetical protein